MSLRAPFGALLAPLSSSMIHREAFPWLHATESLSRPPRLLPESDTSITFYYHELLFLPERTKRHYHYRFVSYFT